VKDDPGRASNEHARAGMFPSRSWGGFPHSIAQESGNPRASPSGHLEQGESIAAAAVRETREETGIALDPTTLRLALSIHQRNRGGHARIGFAFEPASWSGEPANTEPHKHSELVWADPGRLPPDTVDYTAAVITAVEHGLTFTLNGP
jgi:8-oxo-dGTP diphosphatase